MHFQTLWQDYHVSTDSDPEYYDFLLNKKCRQRNDSSIEGSENALELPNCETSPSTSSNDQIDVPATPYLYRVDPDSVVPPSTDDHRVDPLTAPHIDVPATAQSSDIDDPATDQEMDTPPMYLLQPDFDSSNPDDDSNVVSNLNHD